jgi:hypothetical protein
MRRRRQKQAEEAYRRNAANVDQFVAGGKLHTSNSSMNDSRIDPSFVDRRQSNGSIADNEDYSRRILKVWTHPLLWHARTNRMIGHQRISIQQKAIGNNTSLPMHTLSPRVIHDFRYPLPCVHPTATTLPPLPRTAVCDHA